MSKFMEGQRVRALCRCHKGQEGVVKYMSRDGSLVSIDLPGDNIALLPEEVEAIEEPTPCASS